MGKTLQVGRRTSVQPPDLTYMEGEKRLPQCVYKVVLELPHGWALWQHTHTQEHGGGATDFILFF